MNESKLTITEGLKTAVLVRPPDPVGYWILDPNAAGYNTHIAMRAKPTDEQITNTEKMFGWKWKDA